MKNHRIDPRRGWLLRKVVLGWVLRKDDEFGTRAIHILCRSGQYRAFDMANGRIVDARKAIFVGSFLECCRSIRDAKYLG